jgi:hypothetical protein
LVDTRLVPLVPTPCAVRACSLEVQIPISGATLKPQSCFRAKRALQVACLLLLLLCSSSFATAAAAAAAAAAFL